MRHSGKSSMWWGQASHGWPETEGLGGHSTTHTCQPQIQSEPSFKGVDLIGGGEPNIFNSSSVSLLFLKIPWVIYRALFGLVLVKGKWATTSVRWVGRRECPGTEWGHPKWLLLLTTTLPGQASSALMETVWILFSLWKAHFCSPCFLPKQFLLR